MGLKNHKYPKRDFDLTIENYEKFLKEDGEKSKKPNKEKFIQYLNDNKYRDFFIQLLNYRNSGDYINLVFSAFIPESHDEQVYLLYLKFLEILKVDYPQFILGINYLQNEVIKFYTHFNDDSLTTLLNEKEDERVFIQLKNYFKLGDHFQHSYFEHNKKDGLIGGYLKYITINAYNDVRDIIYSENKSIFEVKKILNLLEEEYNNHKDLKNIEFFLPAMRRVLSLMSVYYNIKIKYAIDTQGKTVIKPIIDEYLDDLIEFENYIKYFKITSQIKFYQAMIEIINFYNMIKVNLLEIQTKKNKINFHQYFHRCRDKLLNDASFFTHSVFKRLTKSFYEEVGLCLLSSTILEEPNNSLTDSIRRAYPSLYNSVMGNFGEKKLQQTRNESIIPLDFIWRS